MKKEPKKKITVKPESRPDHGFFIYDTKRSNQYTKILLDNLAGLFMSAMSSGMSTINVMTIVISVMARMVDDEEKLHMVMESIANELNSQMLLLAQPASDRLM